MKEKDTSAGNKVKIHGMQNWEINEIGPNSALHMYTCTCTCVVFMYMCTYICGGCVV